MKTVTAIIAGIICACVAYFARPQVVTIVGNVVSYIDYGAYQEYFLAKPVSTKTVTPTKSAIVTPSATYDATEMEKIVTITPVVFGKLEVITGVPNGTLNMRDGPSTVSGVVAYLREGQKVDFLGICRNGFAYIQYNGITGYAYAKYLGTDTCK